MVGGTEATSLGKVKWEVKLGYFGVIYCCLGGPGGAPMVPDGRCVGPGHRLGRLSGENE